MGMKSRGVYETPGGTVLLAARRAMESICLDRGEMHLKDELMPRYLQACALSSVTSDHITLHCVALHHIVLNVLGAI